MIGRADRGTAAAMPDDRSRAGLCIPGSTCLLHVQVAKAARSALMCANLEVTRIARFLRVLRTVYYWWQETQRRPPIAGEQHHREKACDFSFVSYESTLARTSQAA